MLWHEVTGPRRRAPGAFHRSFPSRSTPAMQTYSAAFAPWRLRALHARYVARALEHLAVVERNGGGVPKFRACLCPYCGRDDRLVATVRLGTKDHVNNVPVTAEGYQMPLARGRDPEPVVLYCQHADCGAVIEPLAYLSPMTFYQDKAHLSARVALVSERAPKAEAKQQRAGATSPAEPGAAAHPAEGATADPSSAGPPSSVRVRNADPGPSEAGRDPGPGSGPGPRPRGRPRGRGRTTQLSQLELDLPVPSVPVPDGA